MRVYYYVCPRCGRPWKKFLPHFKMKCKFCSETWRTRGHKGTHSRFSICSTFLWLFWIAVIGVGGWKGWEWYQMNQNALNTPVASVETAEEPQN